MAPALEDGPKVAIASGGGPMGSFGPSAALLERTGLGGSGGFHLGVGFIRAAVGSVVVSWLALSSPCQVLVGAVVASWAGTCGGGVSGTSSVALGGHGVSGVVCGVSGGLVGMAGGCTVLGGYLSLGGATGVGPWAGAAVSLVGGALLGSCGAWTSGQLCLASSCWPWYWVRRRLVAQWGVFGAF